MAEHSGEKDAPRVALEALADEWEEACLGTICNSCGADNFSGASRFADSLRDAIVRVFPPGESQSDWPTIDEWPDLTRAADVLYVLCDCGVPEGESEATDPRDRSVRLPHHFDCAAVTAWRALADAGYRVLPPGESQPE